jgi:hypothetical protein
VAQGLIQKIYKQGRSSALDEWRAIASWIGVESGHFVPRVRRTAVTLTTPARRFSPTPEFPEIEEGQALLVTPTS